MLRRTRTPLHPYPPQVTAVETDIFSAIFGRTGLTIGASKAKNCEQFDFEVCLPVQPPKLAQKGETSVSSPKMLSKKKNRRKLT